MWWHWGMFRVDWRAENTRNADFVWLSSTFRPFYRLQNPMNNSGSFKGRNLSRTDSRAAEPSSYVNTNMCLHTAHLSSACRFSRLNMQKYTKEKVMSLATATVSALIIHKPFNSGYGSIKINIEIIFQYPSLGNIPKKLFGLVKIISLLRLQN